jgi:hypothetical protein
VTGSIPIARCTGKYDDHGATLRATGSLAVQQRLYLSSMGVNQLLIEVFVHNLDDPEKVIFVSQRHVAGSSTPKNHYEP